MAYRMITSFIVTLVVLGTICDAQLASTFYDSTCPNALSTIRTTIRTAVSKERRMTASLLRLHFHDRFGCDASILLDESSTIESEKTAIANDKSIRGYEIIDKAKADVETICPGVVSCADIIAVATRDASFAVGGPSWTVKLGRRDSTIASRSLANTKVVQHPNNQKLAALDLVTPNSFDNNYFKNLSQKKGLLQSDQVLFSGGSTDSIVSEYSNNSTTLKSDFAAAMIKMGDIKPLTGSAGIIRSICSTIN